MLMFWGTRRRRYATVPGAALGAIIAWAFLPVKFDSEQLYSLTALGITVGASLNAILRRCYAAGLLGLFVVLTVLFVGLVLLQ